MQLLWSIEDAREKLKRRYNNSSQLSLLVEDNAPDSGSPPCWSRVRMNFTDMAKVLVRI
jgi:hypothetical protein